VSFPGQYDYRKMKESAIELAVCKHAKSRGVLCYKFNSAAFKGVPDRLFLYKGETLFIEFKAWGKTPSILQAHRIAEIEAQGHTVKVIDNITDGMICIESFIRSANEKN